MASFCLLSVFGVPDNTAWQQMSSWLLLHG